jgi:hypothetical protein
MLSFSNLSPRQQIGADICNQSVNHDVDDLEIEDLLSLAYIKQNLLVGNQPH